MPRKTPSKPRPALFPDEKAETAHHFGSFAIPLTRVSDQASIREEAFEQGKIEANVNVHTISHKRRIPEIEIQLPILKVS